VCKTGSVMLRRGQSVTVFGNRMLMKVCRHKNDVAARELRKLHDE